MSPEKTDVREDDGFHLPEVSMWHTVKARYVSLSRGLSPWYDIEWKLQELGRALKFPVRKTHQSNRDRCDTQVSRRLKVIISSLRAIRTKEINDRVGIDKFKRQGYTDDFKAVGLTHSRGVVPVMRDVSDSEGYSKGLALVCKGKGTHRPDAERRNLWKRN